MLGLLPFILTAAGAYMLVKLRFFFVLHPIRTLKKTLRAVKDIDTAKSVSLALAGTLGVGNVFGVCLGIIIGGPGSVFWLLVSSLFASVLKYCEVTLSNDRSEATTEKKYGMISTLRSFGDKGGTVLSFVYALSCFLLSLFMGSALQCGTVSEATGEIFNTPPLLIGVLFALLTLASIAWGVEIIEKITLIAIPVSTIIYIVITASVIALHIDKLPGVISLIFTSALSPKSGVGGIIGLIFSPALREGYSRGLLSNEAGCGTSSLAHSRSGILNPALAGLMGILEVVFDTVILCSLTALSVLCAVPDTSHFTEGMSLIVTAVGSTLGGGYVILLLLLVFVFAYATVLCWYYYGSLAFSYVTRGRFTVFFLPLYLLFVALGAVIDNRVLVYLSDLSMLVLAGCTVFVIIKKSDRVLALSEQGGILPSRKFIRSVSSTLRAGARASVKARSRK